jgi:hypothetical protein
LGNLIRDCRGIITVSLSPFEQRAFPSLAAVSPSIHFFSVDFREMGAEIMIEDGELFEGGCLNKSLWWNATMNWKKGGE